MQPNRKHKSENRNPEVKASMNSQLLWEFLSIGGTDHFRPGTWGSSSPWLDSQKAERPRLIFRI